MQLEDLTKALKTGADAVDARTTFNIDRNKYMNASEAMSCIRMQWYQKKAKPGKDQDWGFARRGKIIEDYVVECLRAANIPLALAGMDQKSVPSDKYRISATPDGVMMIDDKTRIGIEIKSIDPRTNKKNLPRRKHVVQLQLAMALLVEEASFTKIDKGMLIYVDASNINDWTVFEVDFDDDILERLTDRAHTLLQARTDKNLAREGVTKGDCKYCPFTKICGVKAETGTGKSKANRGSNLDTVAVRYVDLKAREVELKEDIAEMAEGIKQELRRRDTDAVKVGTIAIQLQSVKGRTSLDKKAVAKAGIDLSPFEKTGAPSTRLIVKEEV